MSKTQVPVNYMGNGRWHFQTDIASGHYELDVIPHLFLYTLLTSNGDKIDGNITGLLARIDHFHNDPELTEWIKGALSWDHRSNNFKEWDDSILFNVDEFVYRVTLNPRTGELRLFFPGRIIISKRQTLAEDFPEVNSIKRGMLSETITDLLNQSGNDFENLKPSQVNHSLPLATKKLTEYTLEGYTVWLSYDAENDLIFIHLDGKTVHTHVSSITSDLWEFEALHVGKYKDALISVLMKHGMMVG